MKWVHCNLCGRDTVKTLFFGKDLLHHITTDTFSVVRCKNCGLAYVNPQPTTEELSRYYPDDYGVYSRDVSRPIKKSFLLSSIRYVKQKIRPPREKQTVQKDDVTDSSSKKFLDVGCGNGARLRKTRDLHPNWILHGLDVDRRACAAASETGFEIHCGNIFDAKYADNQFDVVNMDHVIEHLQNPIGVLAEVKRILKPGGLFSVSTPNWGSIWAKLFRSNWFHLDIPRHLYFFNEQTLSRMLQDTGFRVENIEFQGNAKDILNHFSYLLFGRIPRYRNLLLIRIFQPLNILSEKLSLSDVIQIRSVKNR